MFRKIKQIFLSGTPYQRRLKDIDPDEIFLDSQNLPKFNVHQFEGRMEKTIPTRTFFFFGGACLVVLLLFFWRSFDLEIIHGAEYFAHSENNRLRETVLFTKRGVIYDRNQTLLAWNVAASSSPEFALRAYDSAPGLAHVVGYLKYPSKDSSGFYYNEDFVGKSGVEKYYNDLLMGENGQRLIEVDAQGRVQSQSVVRPPQDGQDITLSIDAPLTSFLYTTISDLAKRVGFTGGAGVIMDIHTGEILAMTSYPEYSSQVMTDGTDSVAIENYFTNLGNPFLDRVFQGLYTPGSIVKPYMAVAALQEHVIASSTKILSTGSISIPNPYDPAHPSIFRDWRPQGWVDMEHAIAVSSDVYFYEVGGGYQSQPGLGIDRINKYMHLFGFGTDLPNGFFSGLSGTIPSPAWKAANFNGEAWNIGDTYHTSIGQYGFQVSPIQVVRAVASLANGGKLMAPSIVKGGNPNDYIQLNFDPGNLAIVREGMKLDTEDGGVAVGLNLGYLQLGAKTGTAQLGLHNEFTNSWVTGFFPFDNPKYAFAVVMEQGPAANVLGGVYVMRQVFDWMHANNSPYLQ